MQLAQEADYELKHINASFNVETHEFKAPTKEINEAQEMFKWLKSEGASRLLDFIMALNQSIANKKKSEFPLANASPVIQRSVQVIQEMEGWIADIPPQTQAQRFGNKAFRTWFEKLKTEAPSLMEKVLPSTHKRAVIEITPYLVESVGNSFRIDYGTGHEMSFAAWMCCLYMIRAVDVNDFPALVFNVFDSYLEMMRKLQRTYLMEPAGSHGVWGLDDHQFLPFLWGSAQFLDHEFVKPKSLLSKDMVESLASEYIFMGGIKYINETKKGPFNEHSPMLFDISGVPLWTKVNVGLHKMYAVEVMGKFPVVQHFLFGSIFTLNPSQNPNPFLVAALAKQ